MQSGNRFGFLRPGWKSCALSLCGLLLSGAMLAAPAAVNADDETGFRKIFDGKTLNDWDGNPDFWSVADGVLVGQTTAEKPTKGNTFIIWRGGETVNFELRLEYKIEGGNSGVQFRSFEVPDNKWVVGGYQADIDDGGNYSGANYGERFRGLLLSERGQKTVIGADHKPKVVGSVGDAKEIASKIKKQDWNEYTIIANGFNIVQKINGIVTCELTDEDQEQRRDKGILALQLHQGPPMKVQFRNIRIKQVKAEAKAAAQNNTGKKKIAFVAGNPSHGFGAHEHKAGCMLLAKALNESGLPVYAEVYSYGWPKDASVLDDAATVIIYSDGGGGHPFNAHLADVDKLAKKGVGVVAIHYGVEVPKGESGNAFLDWTGGYFEANWSVNPHWTADYKQFPKHEISRGVKAFKINDEWYYHMRFRENMEGVIPILSDLPPSSTLSRPDGPHSGNPTVREAVAKGQTQHMAWARQRPDGGRGFGFTGGHDHWNWGNDSFRKLVLNAIVWTAGVEVPEQGVPSKPLSVDDLVANQDEPTPQDFNPQRIQKMLDEWNAKPAVN